MGSAFRLLGVVALASLTGCADPIIGKWECSNDDKCGDLEFEIGDDLKGDGDGTFNDGVNSFNCNFDVEVEPGSDSNYNVEVSFTGQCSAADKFDDDCRLDGDTLDCDDFGEYERAD